MEGGKEGGNGLVCSVGDCKKRPRHSLAVVNAEDNTLMSCESMHVETLLGRTFLTTTSTRITKQHPRCPLLEVFCRNAWSAKTGLIFQKKKVYTEILCVHLAVEYIVNSPGTQNDNNTWCLCVTLQM